jgi:hypothetical protein
MNKKAQLDSPIVWFFLVVFGLLLVGPFLLKIFHQVDSSVGNSFGNMTGGEIGKTNTHIVLDTAGNLWDKVIIFAFILSLITLFISAFLVDTSPFWIILYIFINFMLVLFAPGMIGALDSIYGNAEFATEVAQLTFMDWLRTNFMPVLVGCMVLAGIIIYGKLWLTGGSNRR